MIGYAGAWSGKDAVKKVVAGYEETCLRTYRLLSAVPTIEIKGSLFEAGDVFVNQLPVRDLVHYGKLARLERARV